MKVNNEICFYKAIIAEYYHLWGIKVEKQITSTIINYNSKTTESEENILVLMLQEYLRGF